MTPRSLLCSATLVCAFGIGADGRAQTGRDEFYASAMLASDYRLHGLSQTGGEPAWRLTLDYEHDSGFFAGGFVANVDYAAETWQRNRDTQLNLYTGFVWRGSDWSTSVSVSRYYYPDLNVRYDYTQGAASIGYRDRFFLGGGYSDNYLSLDRSAYYYEAGIAWPWIWALELGASAGSFRADRFSYASFTYWDAGLSRVFGRFALDLRHHDSTMRAATLLGDPGGQRWVLSASYAIAPRPR